MLLFAVVLFFVALAIFDTHLFKYHRLGPLTPGNSGVNTNYCVNKTMRMF